MWLKEQPARLSAKSRLRGKLADIVRHRDGRVEMDSNSAENLIRPVAPNRKNALFAGHDEGAAAWGRIADRNRQAERRRALRLPQPVSQ